MVAKGAWAKKVKGIKSTNSLLQNHQGDVKYNTGNVDNNILIAIMVSDGYEIYQDGHLVSYIMSNQVG